MIRPLQNEEVELALAIVNDAARAAYKGVIPDDCWQEPYMPREELLAEIAAGIDFWAYEAEGRVLGVMGRQPLEEVTLIRHAYVRPAAQQRGIGAQLLRHLLKGVERPGPGGHLGRVLVGHPLLRKTRLQAGDPGRERPAAAALLDHFGPAGGDLGGAGG